MAVLSLHEPYPYDPEDGREDVQADGPRVVRGGAWVDYRGSVRCAFRYRRGPNYWLNDVGFRAVLSPGDS